MSWVVFCSAYVFWVFVRWQRFDLRPAPVRVVQAGELGGVQPPSVLQRALDDSSERPLLCRNHCSVALLSSTRLFFLGSLEYVCVVYLFVLRVPTLVDFVDFGDAVAADVLDSAAVRGVPKHRSNQLLPRYAGQHFPAAVQGEPASQQCFLLLPATPAVFVFFCAVSFWPLCWLCLHLVQSRFPGCGGSAVGVSKPQL